jgi:hypothetical protein
MIAHGMMSAVSIIEGANHANLVGVWCLHRKRNAFRPSLSSPGGMLIESLRWRQHEPVGVARPATGQGLGRDNRPTLIAALVALIPSRANTRRPVRRQKT